ncbi:flagellar biosynthesis anti-sigma factor FlgM [Cohnella thailandensis]|uniref:Negative regulator of flagellin synthesis n=1 Tax=Cohnella thailandensis TaxID=557557 RepID=A0A841SR99_9BACL|nr:flagellar biosynthesis anti-sigma factor FlgM [Cohnella thailandensis]MBB6632595.1 flagellar biosynthesis anti-sigma factor FlgM [Cohnella thailandensis]MBP1971889.1 negative regulator of flagellin synthesis FlgM [Cohnella thailandensis]
MKINQTQRVGMYQAYQQAAEARPDQAVGKKRKDEVQISAEAKELLDLQGKTPDAARAHKIESLKQEVSTGTYYVDTDKLAERILPFIR